MNSSAEKRVREVDARGNCSKCGGTHCGTGWYCPMPDWLAEGESTMEAQIAVEMPRYKCHKEVWALKIAEVHPGRRDGQGPGVTLVFAESGYAPLSLGEDFLAKHDPVEGGYYVVYKDGYKSFSPAAAFEEGYSRV